MKLSLKRDIVASSMIILIAALFLLYMVFDGGSLGGLVITGTNSNANFIAFALGLAGLVVGAGMAFFGFAFHSPHAKK